MNDVASNVQSGAQTAWANIAVFVPKLLLAIVILVVGYLIAKALSKVLDRVLERMGFDRLVERGGIKRMLARTNWDASGILSKLVFYFVMLFTLQLAFGVFGPNPISDLLNRIIGYLPSIFVAAVIIVVAAAIATAVKKLVDAALGGVSYGRL